MRLKSLLTLALLVTAMAGAEVKLPALMADGMVMQRDVPLTLTGWCNPGEWVTVQFRGTVAETQGTPDGRWSVTLPAQSAGGPFVLDINNTRLRDVLVGDVWLCSGQSNQETPIARVAERYPEINTSDNHHIRHYKVPAYSTYTPAADIQSGQKWHSGIASDVMNWTALAYFVAQEEYERTGVPQGMIVSSLGGSEIASWTGVETAPEAPVPAEWQKVTLPGYLRDKGIDVKGSVMFRKTIDVPPSMAGRAAKMAMGTLVDVDVTRVNGTYVGSTGYQYPPRRYDVPAGVLKEGKNEITVCLSANDGNGAFIPDKPYYIATPTDTLQLAGEWEWRPEPVMPKAPSNLYNGMIAPLKDVAFKGVIWYQGETDANFPEPYAEKLKALIDNWRRLFGNEQLPFVIVQLPNFLPRDEAPSDGGWPRIREAQLKVTDEVPATALVVTYDTGEWNDIHPLNKKTVAQRIVEGGQGPRLKSVKTEGSRMTLTFDTPLRTTDGEAPRHFAIAAEDGPFVWADAKIKGNTVILTSPEVASPAYVRYAWANNPDRANLCSRTGVLATPFRTDAR